MKHFFFYNRSEKAVILILLIFITGIIIVRNRKFLFGDDEEKDFTSYAESPDNESFRKCFSDFASLLNNTEPARNKTKYEKKKVIITPSFFDPNTADSIELTAMGIPSFIIRNINAYRNKGGVFRKKEKLAEIYGMKKEYYEALKDYIRIDSSYFTATFQKKKDDIGAVNENMTTERKYPEKFTETMSIDINETDSATLLKIPGIGPAGARAIIGYRKKLGGYYDLCQISELTFIHDSVTSELGNYLFADISKIEKIKINIASLPLLRSHPYINFYQAKCITDFRKRKYITSESDLRFSDEFSDEDMERMKHYLDFTIPGNP